VAAVALAAGGFVLAGSDISPLTATETVVVTPPTMGCNDWPVQLSTGECQAAGTIRYVSLVNLQGAAQFCKWKSANQGEWSRLKAYAASTTPPMDVVTWLGSSILNQLQAYFVTGAPSFVMPVNDAPNKCRTPLPPPGIASVIPGQTDVTVTVSSP
jgi:hypothetical protein